MQRHFRFSRFGSSEGQSAPPVGVGRGELAGPIEGGECLTILELANQVLAVSQQQRGVVGMGGKQCDVELIGACRVARLRQDFSQHAGDGEIVGMGGVKLLKQRQRFRFVLGGEHRGELSREGSVVGRFLQR